MRNALSRIAVVLLLLLLACRPSAMREAEQEPWFTALAPCDAPAPVDMSGWQTLRAPGREIAFQAPQGFERVPTHYVEGGTRWVRGQSELILKYGHWGIYGFSRIDRKCRTVVDGIPIVRMSIPMEKGAQELAWFVASAQHKRGMDVLLRLKSKDPADAKLFAAIVGSAER